MPYESVQHDHKLMVLGNDEESMWNELITEEVYIKGTKSCWEAGPWPKNEAVLKFMRMIRKTQGGQEQFLHSLKMEILGIVLA